MYQARQSEADTLPDVDRRELNITIYQERLSELDAELAAGTLDPDIMIR